MSAFDVIVSLLRGTHVAATVSLAGTLLFILAVLPPAASQARRVLVRLARIGAVVSLVLGIAWLTTETANIADANSVLLTLQALPVVALQTQFGQWLLVRFGLLCLVLITPRLPGPMLGGALALAAAALALQPMLGHAGAAGGATGDELIASEVLHLLAAGAWLGGLLPLYISIGTLPRDAAATACRNFTPIGFASVLLLAGTAIVQVSELMGGMPGLFGTKYGHVALVKLGLFLVLVTLAALNRLVLTERLAENTRYGTRLMRASVASEIVLGGLVVVTAAFLASRTPGIHEEPVWPFAWRPSLIAFQDPDLRRELILALIGVAIAAVSIAAAILWRRYRWLALGTGIIVLATSVPHLDLLFVEAFPTSFFTSPTDFAATAIVHGAHLFSANCTRCHGTDGRGDGPAAKSLPTPPADLTAAHFRAHTDGELYWYVSHGFTTYEGEPEMPGFAGVLSSEAIWDLIDYLHALNAGYNKHTTGQWPVPVAVPQFDALCANGQDLDLDDLRGRPMLIVAGDTEALPQLQNATTIVVMRHPAPKAEGPACIASEPQMWTALSIILGVSPDALAGTEILVDANGWLRATWHPGDPENWADPHVLAAKLQDIAAHPLVVYVPGGHIHHQG
jgi:putative copper export protein/mono/diheme cytochrome c family protein